MSISNCQESEIKENVETQENFSTDQNSTRNDENEDEVVEDTKEDGLITGGQRKKTVILFSNFN